MSSFGDSLNSTAVNGRPAMLNSHFVSKAGSDLTGDGTATVSYTVPSSIDAEGQRNLHFTLLSGANTIAQQTFTITMPSESDLANQYVQADWVGATAETAAEPVICELKKDVASSPQTITCRWTVNGTSNLAGAKEVRLRVLPVNP